MKKKNHVGRPSNEELKIRKIKKSLIIIPLILVLFAGILIFRGNDLNKLMGNSVTANPTNFNFKMIEEKRDDCSFSRSSGGTTEYHNIACSYKLNLKTSVTSSGIYIYWDDVKNYLSNKNDFMYYKVSITSYNTGKNMGLTTDVTENSYLYTGDWYEIGSEFSISVYAYAFHQEGPDFARHSLKFKVVPKENINLKLNSSDSSVSLSWNKISNAAYYIVESDGESKLKAKVTGTTYNDTSIKTGENLLYWVSAYNSNNKKIAETSTNKRYYTTASMPKITRSNILPSGFELEMEGGYKPSKYAVYLKENGAYKKVGESSGNKFKWNGATTSKRYVFAVAAINSSGKENSIKSADYNTQNFYKTSITSLTIEGLGVVSIKWNKVATASYYYIYIKGGSYKNYTRIKKTTLNSENMILTLSANTTYTFKVVGYDSNYKDIAIAEKSYTTTKNIVISATINYTCPTGYSKTGSGTNTKCVKTETISASKKLKEYSCAPVVGTTLSGSKCIITISPTISYSCPTGYTKIGDGPTSSCERNESPVTKTTTYCSGGTYWIIRSGKCEYQKSATSICPTGYTKSGANCQRKYNATVKNGKYSCPNGGTLNSSRQCVITKSPTYSCPKFQEVRGSLKGRTCYYYKNTTTGKTKVCNKGYLYAGRCILTASTLKNYTCPKGYTKISVRSGVKCQKTEDAAAHYEYYCSTGYTKTGSGSNTRCSKTLTKSATVTYTCPSGYTKTGSGSNTKCKK